MGTSAVAATNNAHNRTTRNDSNADNHSAHPLSDSNGNNNGNGSGNGSGNGNVAAGFSNKAYVGGGSRPGPSRSTST